MNSSARISTDGLPIVHEPGGVFELHDARGITEHVVDCPDAPTLTASGLEMKIASNQNSSYQLYLEEEGETPDRRVGDCESVAFPHGRRLRFFAVPPCYGG